MSWWFPPPLAPPAEAAVGVRGSGCTLDLGGKMAGMVTILDRRAAAASREGATSRTPPVLRKPDWIRVRAPAASRRIRARRAHRCASMGLVTVCEEAACPNIGECWTQRHATMMIMGDTCTRACAFCNVATGLPEPLDRRTSPSSVADGGRQAGPDACGHHLGRSRRPGRRRRRAFRRRPSAPSARAAPATTIEVLTPDFLRKDGAVETVVAAAARRLQPQPGDRAAALSEDPPGRALLRLAAPAGAGQGARPDRCSPSPA